MTDKHAFEDIRKKAHQINCDLTEEGFTVREIEILGYYLNRIAASYLSHQTHKELEKTEEEAEKIQMWKKVYFKKELNHF